MRSLKAPNTSHSDVGGKAEPVQHSLNLVVPVPEAVSRDVSDRHQVVTKSVHMQAMLTKRCPHSWLTAGRRKTKQSGHSLRKLCLAESVMSWYCQNPPLAKLVQLGVHPDRPSRLVREGLQGFSMKFDFANNHNV